MTVTLLKKNGESLILENVTKTYSDEMILRFWFKGKWKSVKYDSSEINGFTVNPN